MKKLSFKNLNLKAEDLLQRKELKTIFGGYGPKNCKWTYNGVVYAYVDADSCSPQPPSSPNQCTCPGY
jgi:hypothetical protein